MQRLLVDCSRHGYPSEYLVARIHGRVHAGFPCTHMENKREDETDSVIWNAAGDERCWLYGQMEWELRKILAPLFVYHEINTLIAGLRRITAKQPQSRDDHLGYSLLAEGLKKIILGMGSAKEAVASVEKFMAGLPMHADGLSRAYTERGVQGCEELIRTRFFQLAPGSCDHPEVVGFFRTMIDMKNIILVAKHLHWKLPGAPLLIKGGQVKVLRKDSAPTEGDLRLLVRRVVGGQGASAQELNPVALEGVLEEWLAGRMRRLMRSMNPVRCCIGYIWHCFSVTRKRSGDHQAGLFAGYFPEGVKGVA